MYQLKSLEDTIAAISTPTGQGGIGIVRLSGTESLSIADQLFVTPKGQTPSDFGNFTSHYGTIYRLVDGEQDVIDEALVTVMRAPKSYTRENVVEISCHGGMVPMRTIFTLITELGARPAEPGEFTKRAFLNGRIDLTQAEAVLDVIQSKTEAFLKVCQHQLKGELSTELESIRELLMTTYTEIEAIVNFPEDDIDAQGREQIVQHVDQAKDHVDQLLESSEHGTILKEGIKIVLCGKPNVGKSSLLNALLRQPRAIVTEIAGTTRDTIEETAQIRGIPFQLVDTAGVLEPRDLIEEEAIKRSHMYINRADLILLVLDGNSPMSAQDRDMIKNIEGKNVFAIINKCDLEQQLDEAEIQPIFSKEKIIKISALNKEGLDQLEQAVVENVWHDHVVDTHGIMLSNVRHINSLKECSQNLGQSSQMLSDALSLEFVSEEIKAAINVLDSITGRNIDQDLLDKIFSEFCIGK